MQANICDSPNELLWEFASCTSTQRILETAYCVVKYVECVRVGCSRCSVHWEALQGLRSALLVLMGWPLVWTTGKNEEIRDRSVKCQGLDKKSGKGQKNVRLWKTALVGLQIIIAGWCLDGFARYSNHLIKHESPKTEFLNQQRLIFLLQKVVCIQS